MDFITDLPPSNFHGKVYDSILVVVDKYTKIAWYILYTKKVTTIELLDLFIAYIYKDFSAL